MLFFKKKDKKQPRQPITVQPIHKSDGYLQGQLLVSTPIINTSCFHQSVIYLFSHSEDGAMGIIINQPTNEVAYTSLLGSEADEMMDDSKTITVHHGGPVEPTRGFILHSTDYESDDTLFAAEKVAVSANTSILKDMAIGRGPEKALLTVGYAGWGAGQLEHEIEENSWITVPSNNELLFDMDSELQWMMASQSLGFDMSHFSPIAGHA